MMVSSVYNLFLTGDGANEPNIELSARHYQDRNYFQLKITQLTIRFWKKHTKECRFVRSLSIPE
jgi:hypothetical protein